MTVLVLLCALLSAITLRTSFEWAARQRSQISFKDSLASSGLPVATFFSNGIELHFLLDTGSNISYINQSVLKLFPYTEVGSSTDVVTGLGTTSAKLVQFPIEYKGLSFTAQFGVMDLDNEFAQIEKESGVQIHGILGNEVFVKNNYVLDFKDCIAYCK